MLEYFTHKKAKKDQVETKASQTQVRTPSPGGPSPLLNEEDVNFLERIVSAEGTPPPLPDRPDGWVSGVGMEAGDSTGNQAQILTRGGNLTAPEQTPEHHHLWHNKGKGKENESASQDTAEKKPGRLTLLARSLTKKVYDMIACLSPLSIQY
jgi:hypothetical protein